MILLHTGKTTVNHSKPELPRCFRTCQRNHISLSSARSGSAMYPQHCFQGPRAPSKLGTPVAWDDYNVTPSAIGNVTLRITHNFSLCQSSTAQLPNFLAARNHRGSCARTIYLDPWVWDMVSGFPILLGSHGSISENDVGICGHWARASINPIDFFQLPEVNPRRKQILSISNNH